VANEIVLNLQFLYRDRKRLPGHLRQTIDISYEQFKLWLKSILFRREVAAHCDY